MSYFVTVAFDINDAAASMFGRDVYRRVKDDLEALNYQKFAVSRKKNNVVDLPHNTFIAEFDDDVDHQREIGDFVEMELRKIFSSYALSGKFFVSTGKGWHWRVRNF